MRWISFYTWYNYKQKIALIILNIITRSRIEWVRYIYLSIEPNQSSRDAVNLTISFTSQLVGHNVVKLYAFVQNTSFLIVKFGQGSLTVGNLTHSDLRSTEDEYSIMYQWHVKQADWRVRSKCRIIWTLILVKSNQPITQQLITVFKATLPFKVQDFRPGKQPVRASSLKTAKKET